MQNISVLADKALARRGQYDRSVGLPLVVTKTIEAQGIRNAADVKRLRTKVMQELRRRSAEKRKANIANGHRVSP